MAEQQPAIEFFYDKALKLITPHLKQYSASFLDAQLRTLGRTRETLSYDDRHRLAKAAEASAGLVLGQEKAKLMADALLWLPKDMLYIFSENNITGGRALLEHRLRDVGVANMAAMTKDQREMLLERIHLGLKEHVSVQRAFQVRTEIMHALNIPDKSYE
jgi:hypothetical protein